MRQRLTELGIDFVAKQVAPRQEDREGEHEIPLLTNGDGERFEGTDAIFEFLESLAPGESVDLRLPVTPPASMGRSVLWVTLADAGGAWTMLGSPPLQLALGAP